MSFTAKRFRFEEGNTNSISSNQVLSLCFDEKGVFWIGTGNGLNQFSPESGKFVNHIIRTKNPAAPENSSHLSVFSVFQTRNGMLWAGTLGGLVQINKTDGSYRYFPHRFDVFRYGWGNIIDIEEDTDGNLWLATAAELMKFDVNTKKYLSFTHDPLKPQSISYNSISCLFIDNAEMLWVGTTGMGIDIYDHKANRFSVIKINPEPSSRLNSFSVRSILEDKAGDVWISAEVLYKWERKTGKVRSFEGSPNEPADFGNSSVD